MGEYFIFLSYNTPPAIYSYEPIINNFKNATELGAEIIQKKDNNIATAFIKTAIEHNITTICIGKPHLTLLQVILRTGVFNQLLKTLSKNNIDIVILS